jgi:predicted protein tyrosine phosphatase
MRRVLFICSQNKLRSPTAEHLFSQWTDVETDSAGLNHDAEVQLSVEQIEWATLIFVMEKAHRNKLKNKYKTHLNAKRIVCLDIPHDFELMDPDLVRILNAKVGPYLR